ncbi:ATP-binding protein [Sphingomonas sp.]|uniref:ATP-binding protein n=1 Tax=Sphingomonas sp. TaxID=28214 RepID=UPI0035B0A291
MSKHADPGRSPSLARPIFALVIASVMVATLASFIITFNGPPPRDPPRPLSILAATLATGRSPADLRGPALIVRRETTAPVAQPGERPNPRIASRLAELLGLPVARVRVYSGPGPQRFPFDHPPGFEEGRPPGAPSIRPDWLGGRFTVAVYRDSSWHVLRNAPYSVFTPWHAAVLSGMLAAILLLSIPAWMLSRAISRPLGQLAAAADHARAGADLPPLPDSRSREVRRLSAAVRAMHARLTGHAEQRTVMLAAIAHDLGTPLSRLAFWIEQLPETAHARASADIDEMRAMIGAALRFARDETVAPVRTRIDLGALLDSLVEDMAQAGEPATLVASPRAIVRGDSVALRRLFTNLVANAVRYGGSAIVGWSVDDDTVTVTVDDEGPGVDPAQVPRLFEPFVRGDPSRNRATGGTGLGLAIVRAITERHGGEATLANRPGGIGARASVTLPLSR